MPFDALFRTYSMTHPVTALAIMMLHDDGPIELDAPIQRYLPPFFDHQVLRDAGTLDPDDVRPLIRDITIAQLLTHTSDIGSWSSAMCGAYNVHSWDQLLGQVVDNVAALPLYEDPGTQFRRGILAEVPGRVIKVVSGMSLVDFYEERIFAPLGMTETVFRVDPARENRLATVYRRDGDGRLQAFEMEAIPVTELRTLTSSGVGLDASANNHTVNPGEFWWDGSAGTRFWIDPHENMITIVMAQVWPAGGNGVRERFKTLVYDAIETSWAP